MLLTWTLVVLATSQSWKKVDTVDGITIESRAVEGSHVAELKLTATSAATVERLCEEAFGDGKFDPEEPDLKSRKVLEESENSRVTYDQISPPLVANRDYAVRATRVRLEGGVCEMRFGADKALAPRPPPGFVRIEKVKGYWRFEPTAEGKTKIIYVVHADPAGSIPPFLIEGTRRTFAVRWVKLVSKRATEKRG